MNRRLGCATSASRSRLLALVTVVGLLGAGCRSRVEAVERTPSKPSEPAACQAPACVGILDAAALAQRVDPLVVNVTTSLRAPRLPAGAVDPFDFFFGHEPEGARRMPRLTGLGSGFLLEGGEVVTNAHVVADATSVVVRLADDREFPATVVGSDRKLDLALLKLDGAHDLPTATLGSSTELRVGEPVLAVGNPFGLGHTVTTGIVSAKERAIGLGPYDDFIQTDASINPGNSGGPLFDAKGQVVGINAAIHAGANGIGFAIPIDALKQILPALRTKGYVERGKLGLGFQPVTPDLARGLGLDRARGALVGMVERGGPAEAAGIRPGDVIVGIDAAPVRHGDELARLVAAHPPAAEVVVHFLRQGKENAVSLKLAPLPRDEEDAAASDHGDEAPRGAARDDGLRVSDAAGGGARIDDVAAGSDADDLAPGDVIVEAGGKPVASAADFQAAFKGAAPGSILLVRVRRGERYAYEPLHVPKR